uniref:Uncharacterized protein n=1 Tax=Aegilops tauschii subsp. strangulata TaxID=200361 RepID=A0A453LPX9_AEGTS
MITSNFFYLDRYNSSIPAEQIRLVHVVSCVWLSSFSTFPLLFSLLLCLKH